MAFDLSWLWNLLNSITSTLTNWFNGIVSTLTSITNTGQGLFAGLVAFGSQIWDAITKLASTVGQFFYDAYNFVYQGLIGLGNAFGQWLNSAFTFLSQGVTWLGSQFYNIGNWIYNSLSYVWNWSVNTITGIWSGIVSWFSGVATAIGNWWASVTNTVNSWWGSLLTGFRAKLRTTIMADIAISGTWKSGERILNPKSLNDIPYGILGMIASPIVGYAVGAIIDSFIPIPSTTTYPLIPSVGGFTYTPPAISVQTPSAPSTPTPEVPGAPSGPFTGLTESSLKSAMETYEVSIMAGQDLSRQPLQLSYEVEVA